MFKRHIPSDTKRIYIAGNYKAEEAFKEILKRIGINEKQLYCI